MEKSELLAFEQRCSQEEPPRCQAACPLRLDARGFLAAFADQGAPAARLVLERTLPLAGLVAHLCEAPCEAACLRGELGGALAVGLGFWVLDGVLDHCYFFPERGGLGDALLSPPGHDVYMRGMVLIGALLMGLLATRLLAAQRKSELRFSRLVENLRDGLFVQDPAGRITYANQRLAAILGLAPPPCWAARPGISRSSPRGTPTATRRIRPPPPWPAWAGWSAGGGPTAGN